MYNWEETLNVESFENKISTCKIIIQSINEDLNKVNNNIITYIVNYIQNTLNIQHVTFTIK